jgi:Zinc finger, C3HC4 type (RING finger)
LLTAIPCVAARFVDVHSIFLRRMTDSVLEVFTCPLCLEFANEAVSTLCCHQVYCKDCISQIKPPSYCPSCRSNNTKVLPLLSFSSYLSFLTRLYNLIVIFSLSYQCSHIFPPSTNHSRLYHSPHTPLLSPSSLLLNISYR